MSLLEISSSQLDQLKASKPQLWLNPAYQNEEQAPYKKSSAELYSAEARLARFAPLLAKIFPDLAKAEGIIESGLMTAKRFNKQINPLGGNLLLKADHQLPVAGSIKARGGIHEVLVFAERLALRLKLIQSEKDDYLKLSSAKAKSEFSRYSVVVGSTGNLGLSVGTMAQALGFKAVVHMSSDAKKWKKDLLRQRGATVIEHSKDYSSAVAAGRLESEADPLSYFVDDENSVYLFMGYAVAALRLARQLKSLNITVDKRHPLFVHLPAGVGGAPGGITFGLKHLFGQHVHCFFAEPVQAPCMMIGLAGQAGSAPASVYDFALNIATQADGLAVGTASQWICDAVRDLVSGVYTASDQQLFQQLDKLFKTEGVKVEPSAAIACLGPQMLNSPEGQQYLQRNKLTEFMGQATHIAWLTGGAQVPAEEFNRYLNQAKVETQ